MDGVNNVPDLTPVLNDTATLFHHIHARMRVYPQDVGVTMNLIAGAPANTFGNWTQIVPIDTIDFMFMVVGVVVEAVTAATTYFIQLGYSITDGDEPTDAQILGERRIRLVTVPIARATEQLEYQAAHCPANAKVWGRLKTASVNADETEISILVVRHTDITNHISHLPTWP